MNMYDAFNYVDLTVTHPVTNWMDKNYFQKLETSEKKSGKSAFLRLLLSVVM